MKLEYIKKIWKLTYSIIFVVCPLVWILGCIFFLAGKDFPKSIIIGSVVLYFINEFLNLLPLLISEEDIATIIRSREMDRTIRLAEESEEKKRAGERIEVDGEQEETS